MSHVRNQQPQIANTHAGKRMLARLGAYVHRHNAVVKNSLAPAWSWVLPRNWGLPFCALLTWSGVVMLFIPLLSGFHARDWGTALLLEVGLAVVILGLLSTASVQATATQNTGWLWGGWSCFCVGIILEDLLIRRLAGGQPGLSDSIPIVIFALGAFACLIAAVILLAARKNRGQKLSLNDWLKRAALVIPIAAAGATLIAFAWSLFVHLIPN